MKMYALFFLCLISINLTAMQAKKKLKEEAQTVINKSTIALMQMRVKDRFMGQIERALSDKQICNTTEHTILKQEIIKENTINTDEITKFLQEHRDLDEVQKVNLRDLLLQFTIARTVLEKNGKSSAEDASA